MSFIDGYKTYIVGGAIIAIEVGKYVLGLGFDIDKVLMGVAVLTGRHAINKLEK